MQTCRECRFCHMSGRTNPKFSRCTLFGKGLFFCDNPETKRLPEKVFGNRMPGFIGFGTAEINTELIIKTCPKWCPERKNL